MIDIHITDKGVKQHIENASVVDVLTVLCEAIIAICRGICISSNTLAKAILSYNMLYGNKSKEVSKCQANGE